MEAVQHGRSASNSATTIRNAMEGSPAPEKDRRWPLRFLFTQRFSASKRKFQFPFNYLLELEGRHSYESKDINFALPQEQQVSLRSILASPPLASASPRRKIPAGEPGKESRHPMTDRQRDKQS